MDIAKVDTRQFNAMCEQLSKLTAVKYDKVVRAEVGKVLEKALEFTPSLSVGKVKARFASARFSSQPSGMYSPKNRRAVPTKNGYIVYYLGNRYPDALWSVMDARRRTHLAAVLAAKGLAKKSWLQIADLLGINIKAPVYVAAAVASDGKQYMNVTAATKHSKSSIVIEFSNSQPTVNIPRVGGARALERAIQGRIKFFDKNASLAVFADIKKQAKAYPGLKLAA